MMQHFEQKKKQQQQIFKRVLEVMKIEKNYERKKERVENAKRLQLLMELDRLNEE
jgi:hypothetical protein